MNTLYTDLHNIAYLSDVHMSAGYFLESGDKKFLFADSRYITAAKKNIRKGVEVVLFKTLKELSEKIKELNIKELNVENSLTIAKLEQFKKEFKIDLKPIDTVKLRGIKTQAEIDKVEAACDLADKAFAEVVKMIKPGMTEKDIAAELTRLCIKMGAEKMSFDPIIASGENSALPHARPSMRKIRENEWIKMDFGVLYNGYCSDMTRMVFVGETDPKMKEIFDVVLKSQVACVKAAKAGMTGADLDKVARDVIVEAGYGDLFGHGTGHGIGMEVHEYPTVSPKGDMVLEEGMIVSVEPGIYIPGLGGVRIEDLIAIEKDGSKCLTKSPKEYLNLSK